MKTYHYITKDGEGWIKAVNPTPKPELPDPETRKAYDGQMEAYDLQYNDWVSFEDENLPIKWVGDKLPEGKVLREEEIDFLWQFEEANEWYNIPSGDIWKFQKNKITMRLAARLKSQLTQRDGEPEKHMCINCDAFEVDAPKRFCKICLDNLHAQGLTARYENATTREQGEAEQRSSSSKVRKYERMLSGTPKDSEGESRVIGHFEYDLKEGTEKFTPVSSQPVTEPVKGEEAEIPDFYAGWLNTERIKEYRWLAKRFTCDEGTVRDLFCHGIDFAVNQFKALTSVQSVLSVQSGKGEALTPLLPNEKGETYTRSEVEGLLNKFCNEVMVGQASGKIPKHSNGIAQYIIDNF